MPKTKLDQRNRRFDPLLIHILGTIEVSGKTQGEIVKKARIGASTLSRRKKPERLGVLHITKNLHEWRYG